MASSPPSIAVGIIAAARGLGSQISTTFNTVTGAMKGA
jgi:Flp pilus assembly pilin Flp